MIKGFSHNINEMSHRAIMVEQLAWYFSEIIQVNLLGGFEDMTGQARKASGGCIGRQSQSLDLALLDARQSQQLYLTSSKSSSCTTISTQVRPSSKPSALGY